MARRRFPLTLRHQMASRCSFRFANMRVLVVSPSVMMCVSPPCPQLPITGEAQERSLLQCGGVWCGFAAPLPSEVGRLKAREEDEVLPGVVEVSGFPDDVTRVGLWDHFAPFGVESVAMAPGARSATVTLRERSVDVVSLAVRALHGKPFLTGTLQVKPVKRVDARREGPEHHRGGGGGGGGGGGRGRDSRPGRGRHDDYRRK